MEPSKIKGIQDTFLHCTPLIFETLNRVAQSCPDSVTSAAPNCIFNEKDNTLEGWATWLPANTPACIIPFQPCMFEGISVVETLATEQQVLEMIGNKDDIAKKLASFATQKKSSNLDSDARVSWNRCRPQREIPLQRMECWNCHVKQETLARYATIGEDSEVSVSQDIPVEIIPDEITPNYVDSSSWETELGEGGFIGLYHVWKMMPDGSRGLRLYIVCQSSCQKAGLEIKKIMNNLPHETSIHDFYSSEEIWWLSNANTRNRARLIYEFAQHMQLEVEFIEDHFAVQQPTYMAQTTSHCFLHSFYMDHDFDVVIANNCIPTQHANAGITCRLSPWEGIWIFCGPHSNTISAPFGTAFGKKYSVFPLSTVRLSSDGESNARKMGYLVQSAPIPSYTTNEEKREEDEEENEQDDKDSLGCSDNYWKELDKTFVWDGDPDLRDIALQNWARAQLHSPQKSKPSTHSLQSYIAFEDHNIISSLQKTMWEPRYGIVKLIPLCFFANDNNNIY